jgi:hypothetical protein
VLLLLVALAWTVYGVSWLRSRNETRRVDSISSFSRHLSILERTAPGRSARSGSRLRAPAPVGAPIVRPRPVLSPAKKRRKDILTGLVVATGVTGLLGLFVGSVRALFVLSLLLTVAYVALLVQTQRRTVERRSKVRYLGPAATAAPRRLAAQPTAWDERGADDGWDDAGYGAPERVAAGGYGYEYGYDGYADGERYAAARS